MVLQVPCASKPVVGVMSTGDELVEPWENPTGSQVQLNYTILLLYIHNK